jgi:tripartite-type tricarboxylate transporter receptor subunit TctC
MHPILRGVMLTAGSLTALAAISPAHAEYPDRPIQMIVAYAPGGGTDIAARTLETFVEKYLGGDITVVNKAGAGGEVGFTQLATAEPDGYTIGFINTPNILTIPIERQTRYELDSFAPIANIVSDPGAIAALPDSPFEALDDLVTYAKEHPGEVTYGSTGIGSDDHLAALEFERLAGIQMQHVPFDGAAKVRPALLGGHIDLAFSNISELIDLAQEGQARVLGQMSEERWEHAADIPTFKELGYDLVSGSNRGIAAPAGLDQAIIDQLAGAIEKTINDPEFQEQAQKQLLPLNFIGPEAYAESLQMQSATYEKLWEEQPWAQQ